MNRCSCAHQFGEELEEEGEQQQPDVHAVDIGVGGDDHAVVAEVVERIFDVEGVLQQVELLVFVYDLFGKSEAVQRFAAEAEHGLGLHVAALVIEPLAESPSVMKMVVFRRSSSEMARPDR